MQIQTLKNCQIKEEELKDEMKCFRLFDFGLMKCQYSNSKKVKYIDQSPVTSQLMISNFLCKREGQTLKKIIQIKLGNQIITIQDKYEFIFSPKEQKASSTQNMIEEQESLVKLQAYQQQKKLKKKQIHKKRNKTFMPKKQKFRMIEEEDGVIQMKRDTKNIPRNLIRQKNSNEIEKVNLLVKQMGFNNTLVETVINDCDLVDFFKNFLQKPAIRWVKQSKIKDKQSHLQAISIYLRKIQKRDQIKIQYQQ